MDRQQVLEGKHKKIKKARSEDGALEEKEEERESGLDAARKLPINMEITSSSPLLHGSLMARQEENGFSSYYSA